MRYFKVVWLHSFPDEPRAIYSEVDSQGWETRKVEEFPDGRLGFAAPGRSSAGTRLGERPFLELAEIAADAQFQPSEIAQAEFEAIWGNATRVT